ncbi:MAG: UDP-N-acetylglucosamine 1-carboxyvinyltransferase [Ferrovibrio sp.]|uniref:UDP-N-acetylglucosamine 1-carboxyvinyltransferase n=1 Tax=Ferrovibrio sp. TaxID=1917215 RepID=UPI002610B5B1|nr:UDP-N-acetylglucosamine 1-carboxyvinyltransferase [Ferrovibrio sp.]MCW0232980.1 UDP-N-acetylglucosamine 1-carboxyvinyltransferase [Ferrovibrio sp.]
MDRIRLRGGKPLDGSIGIGGAKNAALPLMAASLLSDETLTLSNVPHLADIATMAHLLQQHGVDVSMDGGNGTPEGRTIHLNAGKITSTLAPYDIVRKMRASVLVLGPLLARFGEAEVSLPGGCAIGTRPVDLHIMGMKALGAEITVENGYIKAQAKKGLKGAVIRFPQVSVGATENLLMAAALAEGTTVLENAAREPEIADLAHCLVAMGAMIDGIGSEHLTIHGKSSLHGGLHKIVPDRIEIGTYLAAVAICGGKVELTGARLDLIEAVADKLTEAGCVIEQTPRGISIARNGARLKGVDFLTQPYPGFPTDMQAQMMSLMTVSEGASMITETIFENRFMHVPELTRMGANIVVHGSSALVRGVPKLTGAPVMATDLRASVSLVLAGLAAEGETIVNRVYHLDRGYERLEEKLAACGAVIERLKT